MADEAFDFDRDALKIYVERIEGVAVKKDAHAEEIKEIYGEAKEDGFSTKVMRRVVADRKKDRDAIQGERSLYEAYTNALGGLSDTPLGQAAVKTVAPRTIANKEKAAAAKPAAAKPVAARRPANGASAARADKQNADDIRDLRELGRRAALSDKPRESNPCDAVSVDAQTWDAGWGIGNQERVNQLALADAASESAGRKPPAAVGAETATSIN